MSSQKLVQFVLKFIKTQQPGFYSYDNFHNQLYYKMIEENNRENENLVKSNNKSEKIVIKLYTACMQLNKLEYQYTDIKKRVSLNGHKQSNIV